MFLAFLRLTGFLLDFCISLEHGLHKGHILVAPRLLVGLLGLRGLTCCSLEGLAIAVIATAVQGIMPRERTTMGLSLLAKLLTATLLRDSTSRPHGRFALWVALGFGWGCTALPFCLEVCTLFSTMTHSIASRSGNKVQVDLETVELFRLYWFCHDIEKDNSTMAARLRR
jgi:hypothetical protein